MFDTLQSTEGVTLELEGNDSNLPLEELSDEEEDISGEDVNATALEELEGIKSVQVENAFLAEKVRIFVLNTLVNGSRCWSRRRCRMHIC